MITYMVCYHSQTRRSFPVLITTTLITILLIVTVLAVIVTFAIQQHEKKSKAYLLSGCVYINYIN